MRMRHYNCSPSDHNCGDILSIGDLEVIGTLIDVVRQLRPSGEQSSPHFHNDPDAKQNLCGLAIKSRFWKGNPEILLQDHAVVDSGCSSHMTGNKAYLSDYEDFNGGFVAFGSDPKGGKITGKGTQDSYVAGSSGKDKGPTQEYILLPLQPHRTRIPVKDVVQDAQEQPSENASPDKEIQDSEDVKQQPDGLFISQDKYFNTPNVSATSTSTGANADESSFVYLGGKIPINASTLPNVNLSIDPNMADLEDAF
ncbi:hypothetical protein Tco_0211860 [Tanacetum coccineum]